MGHVDFGKSKWSLGYRRVDGEGGNDMVLVMDGWIWQGGSEKGG